ncbi:MAG: hypothetical protein DRQ49_04550 [Gammaproteobacteria bacterium]|nr:MAG: hypothetical protein DRQ49_04550 [Gammaproteobacteria bacterium]RKZ76192.1 MAG: hypothetical protein DRQ57_04730 [Gammaproteobacteria bacterium]
MSMSVYVPQYQHDIFVSYAQIDDQALIGADKGWVTTLINGLKIKLGQKLGRADAFSLWMDSEAQGNNPVTPETLKSLESAATMVLILSPGYIESQLCQLELDTFINKVGISAGRVFIIEHDEMEIDERPEGLKDLLGYKFWLRDDTGRIHTLATPQPHPEEREYYQRLDDLAHQLADKLKALKKEAKTIDKPPEVLTNSEISPKNTVFIAKVTADLEERRNEVIRYLDQQGMHILPNKEYSLTTIKQELEEDLAKSCLFVQLLSEKIDPFFNYPQFQYECAQAAQLPVLQWREPALDLQPIQDSVNRALLQGSTVIVTELVDFQELVFKNIQPKKEKPASLNTQGTWVFINVAREDRALGEQIKEFLEAESIDYSLPLEMTAETSPTEIREDLEENLLACDAVIVPYHKTPVKKIRQYLIQCRRMQPRREQPLKVVAIFDQPWADKPSINMALCQVQVLECPTLQIETCLPQFIRILKT